jgi:hypothetical protein
MTQIQMTKNIAAEFPFWTLEHWDFEFSGFGLPRRDLIGSSWIFITAPVTVQVSYPARRVWAGDFVLRICFQLRVCVGISSCETQSLQYPSLEAL